MIEQENPGYKKPGPIRDLVFLNGDYPIFN